MGDRQAQCSVRKGRLSGSLTDEVEAEEGKGKGPKKREDSVKSDKYRVEERCQRRVYEDVEQHLQQPEKCEACPQNSHSEFQPEAEDCHGPHVAWVISLRSTVCYYC